MRWHHDALRDARRRHRDRDPVPVASVCDAVPLRTPRARLTFVIEALVPAFGGCAPRGSLRPMKNVATSLPLFESSKRRLLKTLHVRRFEAGHWIGAPQRFEDGELGDREAVRARFGGGRYEVARATGARSSGVRGSWSTVRPVRSAARPQRRPSREAMGRSASRRRRGSGKHSCSGCWMRGSTSWTWLSARASRRRS